MDKDKIGKFIAKLRNNKNLTQEQLAKELHVDRGTISKWERGNYIPTNDMMLKISNFFEINVSELYAGEKINKDNKVEINTLTTNIIEKNRKKAKTTLIISIFLVMFLLILFLAYYFINNYNSISVHTLSIENNKFNLDEGIMIVSKQKIYIKIGEIQSYDENKIDSIRVYYKNNNEEYEIYNNTKIETTIINIFGNDEIFPYKDINYVKENLYIDISYNEIEKEMIKIITKKDFVNNNIFSENSNSKIEKNNLKDNIPEYIENEFEFNNEDNNYYKITNKKDMTIEEKYFIDSKIYIVEERYKEYTNYFEYYLNDKSLTFYQIINGEIENNFIYDFSKEKCIYEPCDVKVIKTFIENYYFE